MESPTIGKVSSMYMYAWKRGVKTTYYLRSRPATKIQKATTTRSTQGLGLTATEGNTMDAMATAPAATAAAEAPKKTYTDAEVIACSLENPEACEACQ
jgi:ribonucleoside-diphosphate reductase alpha chain